MPPSHLSQIGIIIAGSAPPIEGFKEGLAELGLVEGTNIHLELRWHKASSIGCLHLPLKSSASKWT